MQLREVEDKRREESVAVVDKLVLCQEHQLQIYCSARQTPQLIVVWIIFQCLSPLSWLEEEMPAEDLTEVMRHTRF